MAKKSLERRAESLELMVRLRRILIFVASPLKKSEATLLALGSKP